VAHNRYTTDEKLKEPINL